MTDLAADVTRIGRFRSLLRNGRLGHVFFSPPLLLAFVALIGLMLSGFLAQTAWSLLRDARTSVGQTRVSKTTGADAPIRLKTMGGSAIAELHMSEQAPQR